ncbi:MAG: DUF6293 family protein [Thermoplasmata archaeon]|nr:DUF6293 family protein [Thermoplasmata archaeon]
MKILITTFGPNQENTFAAMRALPYEKLVLVLSEDALASPAYHKMEEIEKISKVPIETIVVDEFDLKDCFREIVEYVLKLELEKKKKQKYQISINISGGSKIMGDAALLAAFQLGIKAYYCDKDHVINLPVITGVSMRNRLTDSQVMVLKEIGMRDTVDDIARKLGPSLTEDTIRKSLRNLRKMGVIRTVPGDGKIEVELTEPGILILETINRFDRGH